MIGAAGAPSAASAAARPPSAGGADGPVDLAAAAAAAAASGPTKFGEGETVILFNGSLCYEAEVLQVQSGDGAAGGKKGGSKKGGLSYLIRYTKWPRRPEEWVGDAFVYPWSDAMAKGATNRPPRKAMWVEQKAAATVAGASAPMDDDAADADADAGGGRRAGRAAKAAAAEDESAAKAGSKRPRKASDKGDEKGARGRSTTPLSDQDDGSAAAANAMALMEDSDAGALMDLMKGGGPSDGRGEDDDGEEDEEEDEDGGEGGDGGDGESGPSEARNMFAPLSRIKRIIRLNSDVPTLGREATFAVTKSTETFLERCVWDAARVTSREKRKTIMFRDVVASMRQHPCPESMQFFVGMRSSHPPPLPLAPSKVPDADGD